MFATKKIIFLITCIGVFMSNDIGAQNNTLSSNASNACPENFVWSSEFKLCATNAFDKPAVEKLESTQRCPDGYRRIANDRLCLLNDKRTRLTFEQGKLTVTKASKKKCGGDHIRIPKAKACVHKRVGLTTGDSKVKLVETGALTCDSQNSESKSCKFKCATGFFRSPELGLCVDYNAALQSNTLLSTRDCKNSTHWRKIENSGICIPRVTLSIVRDSTGRHIMQASERDLPSCQGETEFQITSMVLNTSTDDTSVQASTGPGASSFGVQPVKFCMVRPKRPK